MIPTTSSQEEPILLPPEGGLCVQWWPLEALKPYEGNPRLCPEEAIAAVAASIAEFGWKVPLVVGEEGTIVCGHTRHRAAERLGTGKVPVIVASDLSPAQLKAFRLADNKVAEATSWDPLLLPLELEGLIGMQIDPTLTGFSAEEIAALIASPSAGLTDPDAVPEPPAEPITQPGDLWLLGEHRLLCGDATKPEDVARLMVGRRATLMATDPPYLVDYDGGNHPPTVTNGGKWAPGRGNPSKWKPHEASKHWDAYVDHEAAVFFYRDFLAAAVAFALAERVALYQFFAVMRAEVVFEAWREAGLLARQVLVWKKSRAVLTHCDYLWDYEPLLYGWVQGRRPQRRPPADGRATWEVASTAANEAAISSHPTVKPVELVRRPIAYHTRPGEVVYEPFSGSGTALIAAQMTGRLCYALELSPAFCDVAVQRWRDFTAGTAIREAAP